MLEQVPREEVAISIPGDFKDLTKQSHSWPELGLLWEGGWNSEHFYYFRNILEQIKKLFVHLSWLSVEPSWAGDWAVEEGMGTSFCLLGSEWASAWCVRLREQLPIDWLPKWKLHWACKEADHQAPWGTSLVDSSLWNSHIVIWGSVLSKSLWMPKCFGISRPKLLQGTVEWLQFCDSLTSLEVWCLWRKTNSKTNNSNNYVFTYY